MQREYKYLDRYAYHAPKMEWMRQYMDYKMNLMKSIPWALLCTGFLNVSS